MSSYYITKIIEDSKGFLWIGTQDGLDRYDGYGFLKFNKQYPEKQRLGGSYISDIVEDKKRELLWVATSYGDICAIDLLTGTVKKRITKNPEGKNLSEKWIRSILITGDTLWIGLLGGIYAYDIGKEDFVSLNISDNTGIKENEINVARIIQFGSSLLLCCDELGVIQLDLRSMRPVNLFTREVLKKSNLTTKLRFWDGVQKGNSVYLATSWGIKCISVDANGKLYLLPVSKKISGEKEAFSCAFDKKDQFWFSTSDNLYSYSFNEDKLLICSEQRKENDTWFNSVYQIYCGNQKAIYIGTQEGLGIFYDSDKPFMPYFKSAFSDDKLKHLYSIMAVNDSIIYCGDENGIFNVNLKSAAIRKISNAGTNLLFLKSNRDKVYVSGSSGLFNIELARGKAIKRQDPISRILDADMLNCGLQYNDSLVVLGSFIQKGLYMWNLISGQLDIYHNDSVKHPIPGLRVINNLFRNAKGQLYILTDHSIIRFDPLKKQSTTFNIVNKGIVQNSFMDMCETSTSYWFGLYGGGLIETTKDFKIKKIITTNQGLCSDAVYKVFPYDDSIIIATTNHGLATIYPNTYSIKNYYQSDGLHSNEFEQYSGVQYNDRIYAGGVNGFTVINPALFKKNTESPKLYISNIRIETPSGIIDSSDISLKKINISSNTLQVTITFCGLNFNNARNVTYSYRMAEKNETWSRPSEKNNITLFPLPPGTYHLQVKAANEDGVWSEPKELILVFLPKWYQTWWFYLLIALTAASILYALYRYRISQIKKQHEIRKNIATDLHDDLGSTLNSVKVFTNLAISGVKQEESLQQVKDNLTEATMSLRDMIWVLDDSLDTIDELITRLKQFAIPVAAASNMEAIIKADSEVNSRKLTKEEKRNLFLICKEAINNSIKYSGASQINVDIIASGKKIQITVADNGKGFNVDEVKKGYGLKNMQYRAGQIKYKVILNSTAGTGTEIIISPV